MPCSTLNWGIFIARPDLSERVQCTIISSVTLYTFKEAVLVQEAESIAAKKDN